MYLFYLIIVVKSVITSHYLTMFFFSKVLSVGDDLGALPGFVGLKLYTGGRRPYKAAVSTFF